ncbi:MAG: hypothetical protein ACPG7U_01115 [Holosporaceae bacterium]
MKHHTIKQLLAPFISACFVWRLVIVALTMVALVGFYQQSFLAVFCFVVLAVVTFLCGQDKAALSPLALRALWGVWCFLGASGLLALTGVSSFGKTPLMRGAVLHDGWFVFWLALFAAAHWALWRFRFLMDAWCQPKARLWLAVSILGSYTLVALWIALEVMLFISGKTPFLLNNVCAVCPPVLEAALHMRFLQACLTYLIGLFWLCALPLFAVLPKKGALVISAAALLWLLALCLALPFYTGVVALVVSTVLSFACIWLVQHFFVGKAVVCAAIFSLLGVLLVWLMPFLINACVSWVMLKAPFCEWCSDKGLRFVMNLGVHWKELLTLVDQKLWWGWGLGSAEILSQKCLFVPLLFPHNLVLQWWLEGGMMSILGVSFGWCGMCLWLFCSFCKNDIQKGQAFFQENKIGTLSKRVSRLEASFFLLCFVLSVLCITLVRYALWDQGFVYGVLASSLLWHVCFRSFVRTHHAQSATPFKDTRQ